MENNIEIEIWKDILGYEGLYQVSNLGNLKSLSRKVNNPHGTLSFKKEKKIKPSNDKDGYQIVGFLKNGFRKMYRVHFLVCQEFLPKKTEINYIIDHINNIKNDNRVSNLQYISTRENTSKDNTNKYGFIGVYRNNKRYASKIIIDGVRLYLGSFKTAEEAGKAYQEKLKTINLNNNGKTEKNW
jgi:hypothetical protein